MPLVLSTKGYAVVGLNDQYSELDFTVNGTGPGRAGGVAASAGVSASGVAAVRGLPRGRGGAAPAPGA